jgi:tetratricopeptide (TPR) repeat protein
MDKVLSKKSEDAVEDIEQASAADETARMEAPVEVAGIAAAPLEETQPAVALDAIDQPGGPQGSQQAPPAGVRAFDQFGREVIIPREEWRTNILPGMLKEVWEQPDQLYLLILNSLNDGFFAEVADAAQHLYQIDTVPARGTCMWAIVLMQAGRLDEAETVLSGHLAEKGEDASVLTNLAKLYAEKGRQEHAEATLWHALELEPNLDSALGWYASLAQERGGEAAAMEALERIRTMPATWRAQLWLARGELNAGRLDSAKALYHEALERSPRPVSGDLLMQMSGDLGALGLLRELIELTAPQFVPELHGLPVGNNLIKAFLDTGNLDPAENVLRALASYNRPDWKAAVDFWGAEIARRRGASGVPQQMELQIGMLRIDGPVWLPERSPARRLFGSKANEGPSVTFLGGTAESPQEPGQVTPQLADALGRITRALPLFLAEQVDMLGAASGRAMLPWAVSQAPGQPSGFVVSGQRWPDEMAVQSVSGEPNQSDYVVTVHVDAEVEPWTADLAFVRSSDGVRIGELTREFDSAAPEDGLRALATEVLELLGEADRSNAQVRYEVPSGADFTAYLMRLEQLLAVRCAAMDSVPAGFLNGEREILDGGIALSRAEPDNAAVRVLLVETLAGMRAIRPEIAAEYLGHLQALEADRPLPMVAAAFG